MATQVVNRKCSCGTRYRTKLRKGGKQDAKKCPGCGKDNSGQDSR